MFNKELKQKIRDLEYYLEQEKTYSKTYSNELAQLKGVVSEYLTELKPEQPYVASHIIETPYWALRRLTNDLKKAREEREFAARVIKVVEDEDKRRSKNVNN